MIGFILILKMLIATVLSFLLFVAAVGLLMKVFFKKVDVEEYDRKLKSFINQRESIKLRKLNRQQLHNL